MSSIVVLGCFGFIVYCIVRALGFGEAGVRENSYASIYQSSVGNIEKDSFFLNYNLLQ